MSAKAKDLAANLFHARQELIHAEAQADLNLGGDAYMIGDRDLTAVEIDVDATALNGRWPAPNTPFAG
jgi:hypothetical protein